MMTEVCEYLHNWFERGQPRITCEFIIRDGVIQRQDGKDMGLKEGQYYRIFGSALNSGVWRCPEEENVPVHLRDEEFTGTVWLMAVPPAVEAISAEIDAWVAKYGAVDSPMMSPYTSESFDGYSYTKTQGGTMSNGVAVSGWANVFGTRLSRWKKL